MMTCPVQTPGAPLRGTYQRQPANRDETTTRACDNAQKGTAALKGVADEAPLKEDTHGMTKVVAVKALLSGVEVTDNDKQSSPCKDCLKILN